MTFVIPSEEVFDSPSVCVSVNKTWVGYVLGVLEKLNRDSTWEGDENAVYDVRQQVEALMEAFANGSEVCMVPIGAVFPFFAGAVPENYLPCDGSEVDKADYPDLYAMLAGYTPEPTPETFRVPDFRLKVLMGTGAEMSGIFGLDLLGTAGELRHTMTVAQMPEHDHAVPSHTHTTVAHTHTQNAHNHDIGHNHNQNAHSHDISHNHNQNAHNHDIGHNHTQNSHNHTQDSHNHTQNVHSHGVVDPGHDHAISVRNNLSAFGAEVIAAGANATANSSRDTLSATTGITLGGVAAVNNAATATNQAATATNIAHSGNSGNTTATNVAHSGNSGTATATNVAHTGNSGDRTATNQDATVTVNAAAAADTSNEGDGEAFYMLPPVIGVNYIIRAK